MNRIRWTIVPIAGLLVQALGSVAPVSAATPTEVPFSYTGAEQTWDVPIGVHTIHVVAIGGAGASLGANAGGDPDKVTGDVGVQPGTTLYIEVGGNGGSGTGGFNGGGAGGYDLVAGGFVGGGGGASDIRTTAAGNAGSLDSRLLVAAGGGGAGSDAAGGNAGQAGGGGASGGAAGTNAGGGSGGTTVVPGGNGAFGPGGNGTSSCNGDVCATFLAGGGGGAGWYGGGGGAGGSPDVGAVGGGGGGGSSSTGAATNTSVVHDTTGISAITITYIPGLPTSGTVDATVTMADAVVCVELSTTAIDFGTRQFGDSQIPATPGVTVTNCGGVLESILAHATDATGAASTTWTLDQTGTCTGGTLAPDHYGLSLQPEGASAVRLSTTNQALETMSGGEVVDHTALIDTPCPGSAGAGVQMSMQILFVATE